ncbi:polysaccharide pyruvyl transferase family protein [Phocaeicola vulgatus]|uniref:Polysaccharide pyruvyl transferase n=1 Tax=Phocaeicola vulgatus TaxID=821 RepID=A0A662ZY70_PHOVU|nr:polysaccharide pyruvyl transferase family protein [Phocaeicola vulgatus]TSE48008.1 polysaccharide pyruvyl transferase [Phocaeicola vulgatus]TSE51673.1 polysaccharide pyruvyl transferase [Phocaeicola vulgatus]
MLEKKIALLTSVTFNNIGNGFIDLGAEAALMKALPLNAELFKVSSNANFAATMGQMFMLKENPIINWLWVHTMQRAAKKLHDRSYKTVKTQNIFSMASMVKCDYFIIPGCVLTVPFFTIYGDLIKRKAEQGSKIIFLGASGNFYTEYEVKFVSEYLRKLRPYAIMTRDSLAYKYYANFTKNSYNGIDNVFFVNLLNLPQIDTDLTPYVVLNIEEPKHYRIKEELKNIFKEKNIVYSYHKPFPYTKVSKLVKNGVIVSDNPMDYLLLYRNASEVYSDRVHACIPIWHLEIKQDCLAIVLG